MLRKPIEICYGKVGFWAFLAEILKAIFDAREAKALRKNILNSKWKYLGYSKKSKGKSGIRIWEFCKDGIILSTKAWEDPAKAVSIGSYEFATGHFCTGNWAHGFGPIEIGITIKMKGKIRAGRMKLTGSSQLTLTDHWSSTEIEKWERIDDGGFGEFFT